MVHGPVPGLDTFDTRNDVPFAVTIDCPKIARLFVSSGYGRFEVMLMFSGSNVQVALLISVMIAATGGRAKAIKKLS